MKQYDLLDLFITGELIHENVSKVEVNEYTESMKWLVGAVDDVKPGQDIPFGEYLVYYQPAELNDGSGNVTPDYTLHDEYGGDIYMIKIENKPQNEPKPAWVLLQYIGENTNTSVIGVYDNLQDLEQGIRSELEHFWMNLVDLKNADTNLTVAQLKEQAISEGVDFLMNRRITLTGKNFHWYVQEVKMNKNVE